MYSAIILPFLLQYLPDIENLISQCYATYLTKNNVTNDIFTPSAVVYMTNWQQ
jgi:hypothetical protein